MTGKNGYPQYLAIRQQIPETGMVLMPGAGWQEPTSVYACDNGVYAAWKSGRQWDDAMHVDYMTMLSKIPADNPPLWVLLPDAVADWSRTVELAGLYMPFVRQHGWPVAIALQDGCDFDQVMDFEPEWVFVAGSTEWKLSVIPSVCEFFKPLGIGVHVGRVNTQKRIKICQMYGVDSCDGTCLNKFRDKNLPRLAKQLHQPCLVF